MRFRTRIRVPAAIDGAVVGPWTDQLLQDPGDGVVVEHDGDAEDGTVLVDLDADDETDARLHATLLAERAPGCEVLDVVPLG